MKRSAILFSLLLAVSVAAHAQTSFRDAVMDYVKSCPAATKGMFDSMKQALSLLNKQVMKEYDEKRSDALTKKYFDGPFFDHAVDHIMVPALEKNATVGDLRTVTRMMTTKEGQQFQAHLTRMNAVATKQMEQKSVSVMKDILAGNTPKAEQPRPEIPRAYREQYYKFYDTSKLNDVIAPMMATISQSAGAGQQEAISKFQNYLTANMKTIYLNMSYDYLTADDISFGLKAYGSKAYHNIMGAMSNLPQIAKSGGMALVMAYIEWLGTQGVALKM